MHTLYKALRWLWHWFITYWRHSLWHKLLTVLIVIVLVLFGAFYGVGQWYIATQSSKPYTFGVTFVPSYAESLGLNPQQTMDALTGIGVRNFRLVSYWDELEPTPGTYDFSSLDWQFQKVAAVHGTVTLSIGLRQPRWPECHMPSWASNESVSTWQPQLNSFISKVVNHYKNSHVLVSYQLENEALLQNFGECTNFSRSRLVTEFSLVKKLDPTHPIIMSRSDNLPGLPLGQPRPDEFGFSIYRRVWDSTFTHRYAEYPFPSWYYASLAGLQKLTTGRDSMVHELQTEAWPPNGETIPQTSLAEQNKSFNAQRFKDAVSFAKSTGMHNIYLWGAEYWYYRMVVEHDPSVWNVAKQTFAKQ